MFRYVDVLLIVELGKGRVKDPMNDPRLKVQQYCSGDIVLIISLERGYGGREGDKIGKEG